MRVVQEPRGMLSHTYSLVHSDSVDSCIQSPACSITHKHFLTASTVQGLRRKEHSLRRGRWKDSDEELTYQVWQGLARNVLSTGTAEPLVTPGY